MSTVTVAVTTIPERDAMLDEAVASVMDQTRQPDELVVVRDSKHRGAAWARNWALDLVETDFIAWLDDDDEFLPHHLETLMDNARYQDVVYTTPRYVGKDSLCLPAAGDPAPWGKKFDKKMRHHLIWVNNFIPITHLVRTSKLRKAGGFPTPGSEEWPFDNGEDWGALRNLAKNRARFKHVDRVTWEWRFWDGHTGGTGRTEGE